MVVLRGVQSERGRTVKAIILVLMLIPVVASAESLRLTISGLSYHEDRESPYNEGNIGYGLGYGTGAAYVECGAYKNSFFIDSRYCWLGGAFKVAGPIKVGGVIGGVTGYGEDRPLMVPYVQIGQARVLIAPGSVYALMFVFDLGD